MFAVGGHVFVLDLPATWADFCKIKLRRKESNAHAERSTIQKTSRAHIQFY